MIDAQGVMLAFLEAQSSITALTGARIYAGRSEPPEGYKLSDGAAIVFKRRQDRPMDERGMAISSSFAFRFYGTGSNYNAQLLSAEALYRATYEKLNFGINYGVLGAQIEGGPESLTEPDTGWPVVVGFFRAQLRKTG